MNTRPVMKSFLLWSLLSLLAVTLPGLLHPTAAFADNSVVTGTVTDSTGATVPAATVKVHNTKTGVDSAGVTNGAGIYRISEAPGDYDITVQKAGFKVAQFSGINLTVDQILTLNAVLEVGAVTQVVEVSGQSVAPIELESGQLSNVIGQRTILEMPLILRDPYMLTLLSPGVNESTTRFGGFSANGQREKDNNFLLDGVDNNDADVPGGLGLNPLNPDSTQEFRVITNNFAAEYGRDNGAIIDVITKSGTNQLHGDVYWFGRYAVTGARDFFNHQPDTPKDPYIRNQFGASAGGPLRKDKTFWFGNYEGNRFITSVTTFSVVPNGPFRTGLFSAIDPDTGAPVTVDVRPGDATNNATGFPLDPTIQKILALYPTPNGPAVDNTTGLYFFPSSSRYTSDVFTVKLDHHINSSNTLSARYAYSGYHDPNGFHADILPGGLGAIASSSRVQNLSVAWTSTIRSNLVNEARFGGNRTNLPFTCTGTAVFNSFGPLDPFGRGSDYDLQDPFGAGPTSFGCNSQNLGHLDKEARYTGTYQALDNLTWVRGTHTLKFGGEFRDVYSNAYDNFGSRTDFAFDPEFTFNIGVLQGLDAHPGIQNDPLLNDEVAMLLGVVANQTQQQFFDAAGTRVGSDQRGFRQREYGLFAQDAWKVRPNLTLNVGMRWDYYGVPFDVHNNFTNLFADASGTGPFTFTVVGPGTGRSAWNKEFTNFEPRVGFAWDPFKNGKTSIRGAYGMFHERVYGNLFENAKANPPFQQPFTSNPLEPLTGLPTPATLTTSATVGNFDPGTGLGGFVFPDLFDPNLRSPYSQNWNFGIQRQITDSLQVEVNYVGVRGLRLLRYLDGNPPQPGLVKALETYCKDPENAFGCVDSATDSTLTSFNLYVGQEFGTLPFNAVNNNAFEFNCCTPGAGYNKSIAKSYYNSLQVNVTQRLSHGVQIHGAYTWAHALDNASDPLDAAGNNRNLPRNSNNLRAEYGNSDFDVRQRMTIDFVYQPNLGRGRGYLNHGVAGRVMEGWSLNGIYTLQTGQPYDIFGFRDNQHTGLSDRPNIVGSAARPAGADKTQTGPPLSAFALPNYDTASNLSRNRFFGPGINNWNVVLSKDQAITEQVKLQLRFEFYNLFNRVQFGQPDEAIGDTGTFGFSNTQVGEADGTTGARQIQFGLKLIF